MSDSLLGQGLAARKAEFAQYVKEKKAADDKAWQEERMRVAMLDNADLAYNRQMEADLKADVLKQIQDSLPLPSPSSTVSTGKDMFFDDAARARLRAEALSTISQHPEHMGAY